MARNERHAEKSPAESHTRTLVLALLHTFDPLLVSLADALHSAVPLPSSVLSSPASTHHVMRAASSLIEAHSASASSASLDTSPPSPLERTHVFPCHASTDNLDCIGGVDARSMESLPSPEVPLVDGELLSASPAPTPAAATAGVARKRPRAQPPRSTSTPVRACMMAESADAATRFFFALPNEALWEAVAALAEAMLVGGCCFCWLRAAASREGKVDAYGRRSKRSSGGGSSTVPSYLLLARVLLHLDHYAREELSAFLVAHHHLCGPAESQTNADRVAVYVNVAATLVRAVALHTAHLLRSGDANDGDDDSPVCGSGSAPLVSAVFAPSSPSTAGATAAAVSADVTFRAVQDSLRQQQRQSQQQERQANHVDTPPSPGRTRAGQRRAATGSASSSEKHSSPATAATLSPPLLSLPLRHLLRRGREAEDADESAFLLLLHDTPPSPLRVASPPRTGSATGTALADDSGFLACVLQTGAAVAAEGAACTIVALSSGLPELLDGTVRSAAAVFLPRSAPSTKELPRAPKNADKADEYGVPASAAVLATWCAELHQLSVQTPATEMLASRLCTDFTLSATRLYHDLHDGAVNTQAEQTARHAADRSRRGVSPALRAPQPNTTGVADAVDTPSENGAVRTPPWTAARWRIRPFMGMDEEISCAEKCTRGPSTSVSRTAGGPSAVAALRGVTPSSRGAVASLGGTLPTVEWVRLAGSPPTSDVTPRAAPTALNTASSTAAIFSNVLGLSTTTAATADPSPQAASSVSPSSTAENDLGEVLGEVGSVLACIDGVCASRTLLDVWAWRYGRNRFNVAAASVISVRDALNDAGSNGERASASAAALSPTDAVVARRGVVAAATAADAGPCGGDGAIGLYHHESGLLYVAGGDTYAMEID